jgi:hypothetical protein
MASKRKEFNRRTVEKTPAEKKQNIRFTNEDRTIVIGRFYLLLVAGQVLRDLIRQAEAKVYQVNNRYWGYFGHCGYLGVISALPTGFHGARGFPHSGSQSRQG